MRDDASHHLNKFKGENDNISIGDQKISET